MTDTLRYLKSHPTLPWMFAIIVSLAAGLLAGCVMMVLH